MSGSGSGGGGERGGTPEAPSDCARFAKDVILSSPVPVVISTLNVGDILTLNFEPDTNQRVIQAVTANGRVAGSVTGEPRLRDCMSQSFEYIAEVLSIQGGACRVKVRVK